VSTELEYRTYRAADEHGVIEVWRQCGLLRPWNNPYSDIERKRSDSPDLFFVGLDEGRPVATCMAGYDGHRGWFYYLAVLPELQRRGIARQLVALAEEALIGRGCPKIDLMVRDGNQPVIDFYRQLGYDLDPVVVLSKRLIEDAPHDQA
jgi:ribosomal protein S18 acetylase RimI-like enzyme